MGTEWGHPLGGAVPGMALGISGPQRSGLDHRLPSLLPEGHPLPVSGLDEGGARNWG